MMIDEFGDGPKWAFMKIRKEVEEGFSGCDFTY